MSTAKAPYPEFLPSPEAPSYGPFAVHGLEIGGGQHPRRLAFTQFDAIDWHNETDLNYELGDARSLPYADGEFQHVFASNLLEHFPATETTAVLTEWARVLEPNGYLELVVPDSMGILNEFFAKTNTWMECQERLLGSRNYPGNEHFAAFTISTFPAVIEVVPNLEFAWAVPSHAGGGIHSISVRVT